MIRTSLSLISFLFSSFAFANGFVGNAGSGIAINGAIFVQDLYSVSAHLNPYIGPSVDLRLAGLKRFSFPVPEKLLLQKLTDLNKAVPRLGDVLILAMNEYDWILVDEELVLLNEGDDPVALPAGAERVQLANRLQGLIRINSHGWSKLDEANKVALLIHEAVYSLLTPNLIQGAQSARHLTGQFFLMTFSGSNLAKKIRETPDLLGLNIPTSKASSPGALVSTKIEVIKQDGTLKLSRLQQLYYKSYEKERFRRFLTADCQNSYEDLLAQEGKALALTFILSADYLKAKPYTYKVSENESQMAVNIDIIQSDTTFVTNLTKSVKDCVDFGEMGFVHTLSQ
ncbi:hypothetical protein AZI86_11625 [Bdellovibrio bacteriovorus]|uniref:Uncharacterized protein n=1 Tax=Bdellovibrio bacteriovorus TaxID=959 RepID=A0A150WLZ1_BDEBC|nr:hypothetical protein [Bdellovibrio bacteriovorus]KYG64845.1 hypothetical protein AZI86_11625 [Bdellovibrio bacteriovorus]